MNNQEKIENAIEVLVDNAIESPHHKNWAYAQALKILMGDTRYQKFLEVLGEDAQAFEEGSPS